MATTPRKSTPRKTAAASARVGDTMKPKFVIEDDDDPIYPVMLVGRLYQVKPPKSSMGLRLMNAQMTITSLQNRDDISEEEAQDGIDATNEITSIYNSWVSGAFDKPLEVLERLNDPSDRLDYGHINQLMEQMSGRDTGNPTS